MVNLIYFDKRISGKRFVLTSKEKDDNINNAAFIHPLNPLREEHELKYLETELHLLDYFKITYPSSEKLSFEYVVNSIPEELLDKVYGVELVDVFYANDCSKYFSQTSQSCNLVFVALLTEEDTGKPLPDGKIPKTQPIGLNDEDWERFSSKFLY